MPDQTPDHAAERKPIVTLKARRYIYGIAVALVPVAITYGLVTADQAGAMLVLVAAVLSVSGTALAHPTK